MPVPSSGQLRLRADINQEVNGNDTDDNVSLGTLSNDSGFTDPDEMSEFYGYAACEIPDATGGYGINPSSGGFDYSGNLSAHGFMRNNGGCDITDCGVYVGTSSNIANATKYSLFSSWGLYTYRYFNVNTGYAANTSHYIWIYATNAAGTKTWSKGQQTVPPPQVPVEITSRTLSGDSQIYHYANGCRGSVINYYQLVMNNTSGSTFSGVSLYLKYTTSYGQTCYNQCRKDYSNQSYNNGNNNKSYYFEWNYNAVNGGYQSCYLCADPNNSPQYLQAQINYSKSGYTTRNYYYSDLYWRYN